MIFLVGGMFCAVEVVRVLAVAVLQWHHFVGASAADALRVCALLARTLLARRALVDALVVCVDGRILCANWLCRSIQYFGSCVVDCVPSLDAGQFRVSVHAVDVAVALQRQIDAFLQQPWQLAPSIPPLRHRVCDNDC
jgi:hypothetical protein